MNSLERYTLLRYCRKYDIDPQEIDSTLTYYENKQHLRSIFKMLNNSLDMFELARMSAQWDQYVKQNALTYYAACVLYGETKSSDVGKPDDQPARFSLSEFAKTTQHQATMSHVHKA